MDREANFWEVIENRRSIRKFRPEKLSAELINQILSAGIQAPNARNRQSWRFLVLSGFEALARLADALNENFRRDMLSLGKPDAEVDGLVKNRKERVCAGSAAVVMFVDLADLAEEAADDIAGPGYLMAVQSAALAGGQMLLAAEALGVGGVWMGGPLYAQKNIFRTFDLPTTWAAQGMLLFGYAAEEPEKKARRPLSEIVRYIG